MHYNTLHSQKIVSEKVYDVPYTLLLGDNTRCCSLEEVSTIINRIAFTIVMAVSGVTTV